MVLTAVTSGGSSAGTSPRKLAQPLPPVLKVEHAKSTGATAVAVEDLDAAEGALDGADL